MMSLIQNIAKTANVVFSKSVKDESFKEGFYKLKDFLNQLRAQDINLSLEHLQPKPARSHFHHQAPTAYMELFENNNFTMSVFVIYSGAEIPLHDHPSMFGLIKVLAGHLNIKSYTPVNQEVTSKVLKLKKGGSSIDVRDCVLHQDIVVGCEDEPCVLKPTDGNIHRIRSINGPAAFLDILAPPYNTEGRDCHYYQITGEFRDSKQKDLYWLKKIPAPETFWCDSIAYVGPAITIG